MTTTAPVLVQALGQGLAIGSVYGLVALGLMLGHKANESLDFAQGDLLVTAAFLGAWLIASFGLPFWLALPFVMAATAAIGHQSEARLLARAGRIDPLSAVLLTIGIGLALRGGTSLLFGPDSRRLETPWSDEAWTVGTVAVAPVHVIVGALAAVLTLAAVAVLKRTDAGLALLASAQNRVAAALCGISAARLRRRAAAATGALAGASGLLLGAVTLVDTSLWLVMLKAMAALVLGGFGSVAGALVGGLLLGLAEQLAAVYLPADLKGIAPQLLIVGVLLLAPQGVFGVRSLARA